MTLSNPHILISNDDGVTAPGLLALAQEMRKLGDVTILAPDHNWSASGHGKTMHKPLRIKEVNLTDGTMAYASDGCPSDCVALALLGFIERNVDLVVSGINPNANIGIDVVYSGTVAAAAEAVINGVPGIAVSMDSPDEHAGPLDYGPTARAARKVATKFLESGFPPETVFNVNAPYLSDEEIKGFQVTRQGQRIYQDALEVRADPRSKPYYWIGGEYPTGEDIEGTDYGAIKAGYVSITPLKLDLTANDYLPALQKWDW